MRVPDEVAVVGFDGIPLAAHTDPSLTTVRQPCHEMGTTAARVLIDHLAGATMPAGPVVLDTSLVIRGSAPRSWTSGHPAAPCPPAE